MTWGWAVWLVWTMAAWLVWQRRHAGMAGMDRKMAGMDR
jgi:hypothetical protein